jgi:hypothetical protein
VNNLILDAGLAAVVDFVRETHAPIEQAIADGKPVESCDFAALTGAVGALLNAIDARRIDNQPVTVKAVA